MDPLESQIAEWRAFVGRGPAVDRHDTDELETHLRDQIAELDAAGLSAEEAFLVAVKRMGDLDTLSREFAREHRGRLWKQLVLSSEPEHEQPSSGLVDALVVALAAAVAIQLVRLAAGLPNEPPSWLLRNLSLFVLPFLAGYFARRRRLDVRQWLVAGTPFIVAALVVNLFPFRAGSATELLVALHLPVVAWFGVAYPYMGGTLRSHERRMDFVRFSGEWFIYYVLLALGGGVLLLLTSLVLEPIGTDAAERVIEWALPSGAAGAVIVAAWLVEAKQRVVENMAPVLTMVFTPLFAIMLAGSTLTYAATGLRGTFDRELLSVFDALLVVVLGLVLYGMSARETASAPGWMDRIQLVAIVSALALDLMVLGAMVARIGNLGLTPNRVAALGLNLVLLVNLSGAAWLSTRFLRGQVTFPRLERWQTSYLPVLGSWAATVVVVLPPLFAFA
jgi:FtsH-binding integral membrane protein